PNPDRFRDLRLGLMVSVLGLWLAAGCLLLAGVFEFHQPFRWSRVLQALGTGVAVALIEEPFFRGALFGVLRRRLKWPVALLFLSLLFAAVHFIKPHPGA